MELKKIFLNFVHYRELSRFEILWIIDGFPLFLYTFSGISPKISSILLKSEKILTVILLLLFLQRKSTVDYFDKIFRAKILAKYFQIQPFSSKNARNKLL